MSEGFEKDLIYDAGMHRGEDSEFYLKKGFRVVAVEASSSLAQKASERLQQYIASGQLTILNVAIAETDGPITFFENPDVTVWGTTDCRWAERNLKMGRSSFQTTVQGMNFANILSRYGTPYYLKIDIEGADILCLEALKSCAERPMHVSIESSKTSWKSLQAEFALFKQLGYSRFKVIQQLGVGAQVCPSPAKEGCYIDHRFYNGASGLFGEELPGKWMDEAESLRLYRLIFLKYCLYGDESMAAELWRTIRSKASPAEGVTDHSSGGQSSARGASRFANIRSLLWRHRPQTGWYDTHATMS